MPDPTSFSLLAAGTPGFAAADWAVVGLYMLVMVALGFYLARGQKTKRDYFLGGRRLSWWVVGCSIIATETSALTFIGVPAMAFGVLKYENGQFSASGGNMFFLQIVIGYVIARVLVAVIMVPHYFKGDVYTPYQTLLRAFGPAPRYMAGGLSLVNMAMAAGVRVYVTAIPVMIVMRTVYPQWGIWESIAFFMIVALAYTAAGGITAVVWTDMIQFIIFLGGGLFALYYIPSLIDGGWATVLEKGGAHLGVWNSGLVAAGEVAGASGEAAGAGSVIWANVVNIFSGPYNIWMGLIGATVLVMMSHGVDQLTVQRVLACRNEREGRKALIFSAVVIFPLFLIFLLVGVCLYVYYAYQVNFDFGIMPWNPADTAPAPKSDYIFPIFMVTEMPPVIKGFLVAGILAAAMSSVSSALSAMSSVAVMDLYRPLRGHEAEEHAELRLSQAMTVVAGVVLALVAYLSQQASLVFNLAFSLTGITAGAMLGAILFAIWKRRAWPGPILAGMTCSFLFMVVLTIVMANSPIYIHWPWYAPIGTAICLGVAWLAAWGTPTPPGHDYEEEKPTEP